MIDCFGSLYFGGRDELRRLGLAINTPDAPYIVTGLIEVDTGDCYMVSNTQGALSRCKKPKYRPLSRLRDFQQLTLRNRDHNCKRVATPIHRFTVRELGQVSPLSEPVHHGEFHE
jgi:hypothetical protein